MKTFLVLTVLGLVQNQAFALTANCLKDNAQVIISNGSQGQQTYLVSYWGQSRNNLSATYVESSRSPRKIGWSLQLKKTNDQSTWKDMPDQGSLQEIAGQGFEIESNEYDLKFDWKECKISI